MIDIQLSKLMNDVPVGYLTDQLWITKGGAVVPVELNEFADYKLTDNPTEETKSLTYEDYERLTRDYFASVPKFDERQLEPIAKHLQGKHDQSEHGRKGTKSYDTSNYDRFVGLTRDQFDEKLGGLTRLDGTSVGEYELNGAYIRHQYRSMPAPENFGKENFETLDKATAEYLKANPVSVFVDEEVVANILDDGKIKNIYELEDFPKGEDYVDHRLIYENIAFGYDQTFPIENRPVSGTVLPQSQNKEAFYKFGENYGSAQIVLKDSVKSRTTYTIGDSLDTLQKPTPLGGEFPRTFDLATTAQRGADYYRRTGKPIYEDANWWNGIYIEAQVHGAITLKDIEKIIFHSPMSDIPTQKLDELGIKWEETEL
jgi:hypothetical protein